MISVEKAKEIIFLESKKTKAIKQKVIASVGSILAEDIIAEINIPSFNNSAMDGYAFKYADFERGILKFKLQEEVKAGDNTSVVVQESCCSPIYTGAPIPEGADTVVMLEETTPKGDSIEINADYKNKLGKHIRIKGEQIQKGNLALKKGTIINPATASYLSALGNSEVKIFQAPKVKIITTGNEIIKPGTPLKFGQIYESNSTALISLLKQQNVKDIKHEVAKDTLEELQATLEDVNVYDIVIVTGGISVGKYDLVADALAAIGVEKKLYKIAQKPGKPLYFGTKDNTLFFALPGNPAAVITSYYEYIYPTIKKMMGFSDFELQKLSTILLKDVKIKTSRAHFLKGKINANGVDILGGQDSHILNSFAAANCLVYLKDKELWKTGDNVEVHLLPR